MVIFYTKKRDDIIIVLSVSQTAIIKIEHLLHLAASTGDRLFQLPG
jgi:hypothetical protein